jgi:hypothetical protein
MRFKAVHIKKGKSLIKKIDNSQWEFADLLVEAIPPESSFNRVGYLLSEFRKAIGYDRSVEAMRKSRTCALAWPVEKRVADCSFTAHRLLATEKDRFKILHPGMTCEQVFAAMGKNFSKGIRTVDFTSALRSLQASISFKQSAARMIGKLSLTDSQIQVIHTMVGRDADALDEVIEAAGLILEEVA